MEVVATELGFYSCEFVGAGEDYNANGFPMMYE
jgi:hypothetical protein